MQAFSQNINSSGHGGLSAGNSETRPLGTGENANSYLRRMTTTFSIRHVFLVSYVFQCTRVSRALNMAAFLGGARRLRCRKYKKSRALPKTTIPLAKRSLPEKKHSSHGKKWIDG